LHRYVDEWKPKIDMSKTTNICVDETASRRGHEYITIVVDGATRKVLFACEGRDKSTLSRFADILVQHGGDPRAITAAAIDMGNPYIGGMRDNFPNASMVFDRFHVTQWMNKAVDRVRRSESRREEILTGTKFLFMKRHDRLNKQERIQLKEFIDQRKKTAIAYQLRTLWDDFYKQDNKEAAKGFLKAWVNAAIESKLYP
jgi:transposase